MSPFSNEVFEKIDAYMTRHPHAEDPLTYLFVFGIDGIINLIDESNGREIKFKTVMDSEDQVEVMYVDQK